MFKDTNAFSGFSVDDLKAARRFYGEMLGIEIDDPRHARRVQEYGSSTELLSSHRMSAARNAYLLPRFGSTTDDSLQLGD